MMPLPDSPACIGRNCRMGDPLRTDSDLPMPLYVMRQVLIVGLAFLGCGSRTELGVSGGGEDAGQGASFEDSASEDVGSGASSSGAGSSYPCYNPVNGQWLTGATATEYCPSCPADRPVPCCEGVVLDLPMVRGGMPAFATAALRG
jgi:hypothetical protein